MDPADADVLQPAAAPAGRADARAAASGGASCCTGAARGRRHAGRLRLGAARTASLGEARDLAFSTLVFSELFRAFAARSPDALFWQVGVFTNLRLVGGGRRVGAHSDRHPPDPRGGEAVPHPGPAARDAGVPFLLALIPVTALELRKLLRRPA